MASGYFIGSIDLAHEPRDSELLTLLWFSHLRLGLIFGIKGAIFNNIQGLGEALG